MSGIIKNKFQTFLKQNQNGDCIFTVNSLKMRTNCIDEKVHLAEII